jgi:hypothetical protein
VVVKRPLAVALVVLLAAGSALGFRSMAAPGQHGAAGDALSSQLLGEVDLAAALLGLVLQQEVSARAGTDAGRPIDQGGMATQDEDDDPFSLIPDVDELPPVPHVPLPEELGPLVDLLAPLLGEVAGRPCNSTGATLALALVVVAAVLPDLLAGLPVDLAELGASAEDVNTAALQFLRLMLAAHSAACGYVPPIEERTMCQADWEILALIPEEVADRLDLLGEPSDLAPAPVGGAVGTVRELEGAGGQEGALSEGLEESLECERLDAFGRPVGEQPSGPADDSSPSAAPVPDVDAFDLPEAEDSSLVPGESFEPSAAASPADQALGAQPGPAAAPPTSGEGALGPGGDAPAAARGGGPWSGLFLAIVLAILASSYVRPRGAGDSA